MASIVQLVIRVSGFVAFLLLLFAAGNGWYVCEGLWQGSGLHGYTDNMNNKYGFFIVWTWDAFVRTLVFFGLAVLFGWIAAWRSGIIEFTSEKVKNMETTSKGDGFRMRRRRTKRR